MTFPPFRPSSLAITSFIFSSIFVVGLASLTIPMALGQDASDDTIWVEGEKAVKADTTRHPWWYDKVQKGELSGNDWISNFDEKKIAKLEYSIAPKRTGPYDFWIRANPTATQLSYRIDSSDWKPIDTGTAIEIKNIAEDQKIDLRFIGWIHVGNIELQSGTHKLEFRLDSPNSNHGAIDCFVLTTKPFRPQGTRKPGESPSANQVAASDRGWFAFEPELSQSQQRSWIDLRSLNEGYAGEQGFIQARGHQFVHEKTQKPVRFWGVNGPAAKDWVGLQNEARLLAKYGVNLVRHHHAMFDENGEVDRKHVEHALEIVAAMKREGIYTHFSIYFPLWFSPKGELKWLPGYNGKQHPFATLYFNSEFQEHYRSWWRALLTTPSPETGKTLVEEPAVMGLEIINEDSFFFWTFNANNLPQPQLEMLESQFATWLAKKYPSLSAAEKVWGGFNHQRDKPSQNRIGFRELWAIANERTQRDQDTAEFLATVQRNFYQSTYDYLRSLGYRGQITCSNWATANPQYLGPIEKYTYCVGDFIDRHGYFGCSNQGEAAEWSLRDTQSYVERSALRFESEDDKADRQFVHPAMDPTYNDKPSMISETTWNRPNRYRTEAPLYYATLGALQDSDAIVHFAKDGDQWSVKPNYFMQPWTLQSPTMIGQFPAAALLYRKGLVDMGDVVANIELNTRETLALHGTPLPQDAAFDELRLKDVPANLKDARPGAILDPLVHWVGRTQVSFVEGPSKVDWKPLDKWIDRSKHRVRSTHGQVVLDYERGVLAINAPKAQGAMGDLKSGAVRLKEAVIQCDNDLACIVLVPLDDQPIATSKSMLLQVMTEEKTTGFQSVEAGTRRRRIESIGHDPWLVREVHGVVSLNRKDAKELTVSALKSNGEIDSRMGNADRIELRPTTTYYLIGTP